VLAILQAGTDATLLTILLLAGAGFLLLFLLHVGHMEEAGEEPLLSLALFRNRTSNLGLVTQNVQWLVLMGISFVVSVFLQTVRDYNAIETGTIFTAATVGVLVSSLAAERLAERHTQRTLVRAGFVVTIAGIALLLGLASAIDSVLVFLPGLLTIGLGIGVMLTPSVNIVQSSFPEEQQGEISGLSRSVSNLGSALGTAIAGTILVSDLASGNRSYVLAMITLAVIALVGLAAAWRLPGEREAVGAA
jgi:MFS family permease